MPVVKHASNFISDNSENTLASFSVNCVSAQEWVVLLDFQTVRRILLVLARCVA